MDEKPTDFQGSHDLNRQLRRPENLWTALSDAGNLLSAVSGRTFTTGRVSESKTKRCRRKG